MTKAVKGIDHVVVMVDGIDAAQQAYEKLGFQVQPRGYHQKLGTANHLMIFDNPNKNRTGLPAEWVLLNRLQWGLNSILAHLGATGDWRGIWRELIDSPTRAIQPGRDGEALPRPDVRLSDERPRFPAD